MKYIKFILCLLFGLMFINAGMDKFFHYMPMPELTESMKKSFAAFEELSWIMPLVGAVEIIGGALFIFPKTRALGAIVILPVMIGIMIHNIVKFPTATGIAISGILLLINIWILADNRKKIEVLVS